MEINTEKYAAATCIKKCWNYEFRQEEIEYPYPSSTPLYDVM